jgi:hypothetical protein
MGCLFLENGGLLYNTKVVDRSIFVIAENEGWRRIHQDPVTKEYYKPRTPKVGIPNSIKRDCISVYVYSAFDPSERFRISVHDSGRPLHTPSPYDILGSFK